MALSIEKQTKMEAIIIELPSHWASPLINEDYSGMSKEDIQEIKKWKEENPDLYCYDVEPTQWYGNFNGVGCIVSEFIFDRA
jgi:hypothetical protein